MTRTRCLHERLLKPLYEAQEEIGFNSRIMERLLRDNRGVKWALDEQLKRQGK